MKKICFVTTVHGTLKSFVLELAKYLHDTGKFEIWFVCNHNNEFKKILPDYIHYYPVNMRRGVNLDGVKAIHELKKLFMLEKFDLVQYSTPNASLYASIAAKQAKVPVRLYCQWGILYVGFTGIKRKIFKTIEKMVCRNSTHIEPDNKLNLEFSHNEGLYPENKGYVIWNGSSCGVNLKKFDISQKGLWKQEIRNRYSIDKDDMVFVFVGRITKDKGINELFAATKRLTQKYNNIKLIVVGNPEATDTVDKELYGWAQRSKDVIFTGFTNEVEKFLGAADVFVLPSYREGLPSSMLQAEAMGLPIIATDILGIRVAMIDGKMGYLVEKENENALFDSMLKMCNSDMMEEYGVNSLYFAEERYNQDELFKRIYHDRKELLGLK